MTDYVARGYLADILPIIRFLSSNVAQVIQILSGGGLDNFLVDAAALRAKDSLYVKVAVMILSDGNGNVGIFSVDPSNVDPDDGVNVIIDSSARHWARQQAPI